MLKVIKYPDDQLRRKTRNVKDDELKTPQFLKLVSEMEKTMDEEKGIGLAAPQVGSDLRVCLVRDDGEVLILINPKIKSYSRKKEFFEEGCLSFPGKFFPIERPSRVKVRARDISGKKLKIKADGILARVLQHEIDHLEGILLVDRVKKIKSG